MVENGLDKFDPEEDCNIKIYDATHSMNEEMYEEGYIDSDDSNMKIYNNLESE